VSKVCNPELQTAQEKNKIKKKKKTRKKPKKKNQLVEKSCGQLITNKF